MRPFTGDLTKWEGDAIVNAANERVRDKHYQGEYISALMALRGKGLLCFRGRDPLAHRTSAPLYGAFVMCSLAIQRELSVGIGVLYKVTYFSAKCIDN